MPMKYELFAPCYGKAPTKSTLIMLISDRNGRDSIASTTRSTLAGVARAARTTRTARTVSGTPVVYMNSE